MYKSFKILLNAFISWDNVQAPEGASELIEISAYLLYSKAQEWSYLHVHVNKWCLILHEYLLGAQHP